MNHRHILSLGALVALTTGAALTGFARPVHLTYAAGPPPDPAAPPMVAADRPPALKLPEPADPEPFTPVEPRPRRPARDMTAAAPETELPPAPHFAAVPDDVVPAAPNIATVPRRPLRLPPAANPLPASPPVAAQPADPNGVWQEFESRRQQPEIRVYDRSGLPGALVISSGTFRHRWTWNGSGLVVTATLPAGEYSYEIFGPAAADNGEPDIAGTLRCRRERRYEVRLRRRDMDEPSGTIFTDIGDN